MRLSYTDLIGFEPIITNVGKIKPPYLRDINKIGYITYSSYINALLLDPKIYYFQIIKDKNYYNNLSDDERANLSTYDLIRQDNRLQELFSTVLNFFFIENISYNYENNVFVSTDNNNKIVGIINKNSFPQICGIILQMNYMNASSKNKIKFKNDKAKKIWEKLNNKKEKQTSNDMRMDLGNIISSLSGHRNLNIINIWELTVYQLYDQFYRERLNISYNIYANSISIYGNKDNKFDIDLWFKYIGNN